MKNRGAVVGFQQTHWRLLARRFWVVLFALIIALAVIVQLCREAFPLLNEYRSNIALILSERLGAQVDIQSLEAVWSGFRPRLKLIDVTLASPEGDISLSVDKASIELSLIDSFIDWRLAWRRLEFNSVHVALQKAEDGRWSLRGIPRKKNPPPNTAKRNNTFSLDDPLDVFLIGRYVHFSDLKLEAYFATGHHTEVSVPTLTLENDGDFHRILANAEVDGNQESLKLIVEGQGDPRVPAEFDSVGFLSLKKFPMERVLAALPGNLWEAEKDWREGHRLNLSLWYKGNVTRSIALNGHLESDGLPLNVPDYIKLPSSFSTVIAGGWHHKKGWDIQLNKMQIGWQEFSAPQVDIHLTGEKAKTIKTGVIDIQPWHRILVSMGLDKSHFGKTLVGLAPKGVLHDVSIDITNKKNGYFVARGWLEEGSIEAVMGVPHMEKVNAIVELTANGGTGYIRSNDGFVLDLPKIYAKPLNFQRAEGRINWSMDWQKRLAFIGSGLLTLENENEVGHGYLHLTLPFARKYGESKMTLSVGVKQAMLANYHKYLPNTVPKDLYQWLTDAVGDGHVSDVQLLYSGSLDSDPEEDPAFQLIGHVVGADLRFDPEWPRLTDVDGQIYVDNIDVDATVSHAVMMGAEINNAYVKLVDTGGDSGGDSGAGSAANQQALDISASMKASASAAMDFLKSSPIHEAIGSVFDSWLVEGGDVAADVELLVPLTDPDKMSQSVSINLSRTNMNISDIDLQIAELQGQLKYDTRLGLSSTGLYGSIWGRPVQAVIDSPLVKGSDPQKNLRDIQISFEGVIDAADVYGWTLRPELRLFSGSAVTKGVIQVPAQGTQEYAVGIQLNSNLQGVALDFPEPFAKSAQFQKPFSLNIKLYDDYERYLFDYDGFLQLLFETGAVGREAALLTLYGAQGELEPGYFNVIGRIPNYDMFAWDDLLDKYLVYSEDALKAAQLNNTELAKELPIRLNLDIDQFQIGDTVYDNVHVDGFGVTEKWEFDFTSKAAAGHSTIYTDDRPVVIKLDYFHIEGDDTADVASENLPPPEAAPSYLADTDLSQLIPIDLSVGALTIGGEDFGRWQCLLRPVNNGIVLNKLQGHIRGVDVGKDKSGAKFQWLQENGGNSSFFSGNLYISSGASVLKAWGQDEVLDAEKSNVFAEVGWPGAPDEISLETIEGRTKFSIEHGNFIRGAQQGENPLLRLIALFNFDTIARRLRLDFSDLAKEGFAFDEVKGDLEFSSGRIFLHDPVIVESSSSKMQLAGIIDVVKESIDAQLVVTLPVAGDLTLATALVAGLPAAAGLYLVSKIFKKQVDKVSSINYQITGGWEDPKIKFKKIFDDSAAKKKAREVKNQTDSSNSKSDSATQPNPGSKTKLPNGKK